MNDDAVYVEGAVPVDWLSEVINILRSELGRDRPVNERAAAFWSFVVEARDLGASDVVVNDCTEVAVNSGLVTDLGHRGREDVEHLISWALRGWNPFARGPLR